MDSRLELEAATRSIASAFEPLECVVEVWDYGQKVRFRVYTPENKPLLTVKKVLAQRVREPDGLAFIVSSARMRVEAKGYKLKSWKPPAMSRCVLNEVR